MTPWVFVSLPFWIAGFVLFAIGVAGLCADFVSKEPDANNDALLGGLAFLLGSGLLWSIAARLMS